jgi:hypothetical protein
MHFLACVCTRFSEVKPIKEANCLAVCIVGMQACISTRSLQQCDSMPKMKHAPRDDVCAVNSRGIKKRPMAL